MMLNNPFCDICERYCEVDWYEVKTKYHVSYRDLSEKRTKVHVICGKCRRALLDLIKERSLEESEEE